MEIKQLVRVDLQSKIRPDSGDLRDEEEQAKYEYEQKIKFDNKLNDQFNHIKRSQKLNKLLLDSFHNISQDYEESSASKGAWQQSQAKLRLRSGKYKFEH